MKHIYKKLVVFGFKKGSIYETCYNTINSYGFALPEHIIILKRKIKP